MQLHKFSLGGNLQQYRIPSRSNDRPLLLPLMLPANLGRDSFAGSVSIMLPTSVGRGSFAGSASDGLIRAISSRYGKMEGICITNVRDGSSNAEKAHPHRHVVDLHRDGCLHTVAATRKKCIQVVEGDVGAPQPDLTK